MNLTPELQAREKIDKALGKAGWIVQNFDKADFGASSGIAIREYPTDSGPADYILFVDRIPVGVIEAKREEEAQNITRVEEQSTRYATSDLKFIGIKELPFVYESIGLAAEYLKKVFNGELAKE